MDYFYTIISFLILLLSYKFYNSRKHNKNLPPSPPYRLPFLGHLHLLKPPVHRILHKLSQKYGPIMSLKFGYRLVIVISSSSAAEECFTKNDIILANRPIFILSKPLSYNFNNIISVPYGPHWRNLRKIGTIEIFSTHRLNKFQIIRRDEIKRLLVDLSRDSRDNFAKVEMKSRFINLTFNVIMLMVAGKRYYGNDLIIDGEERKFTELIEEIVKYSTASNTEDFLPLLSYFNGGKLEKKGKYLAEKTDVFLQSLIDEHRSEKSKGLERNTMISHLLSLQESDPESYSDQIMKGLIIIMLLAGTDTSALTLEWAMSNLVNHPHILTNTKLEIDAQIGQERWLEESDLSKLPYLQNVISETLRLYPVTPLLVPHYSSEECTVGGYNVPKDTIVMFNSWAIHRDPNFWEDPTSFRPERFKINGQSDQAYNYMPFGLGRRACPGAGLAQRVVGLTLGSLIQCYEWKRVDEKLVDMTEGTGLSMPKAEPLVVLCKARKVLDQVLNVEA